jgi:PadR family transcriptional regulator PadR
MGRGDELVSGTLDMLIPKTVSRGEAHGYAIAQSIELISQAVLHVDEGARCPALQRLEVRGVLRSTWGVSENNRRAKYYSLTAAGRRELEREATSWDRVAAAIARVMQEG